MKKINEHIHLKLHIKKFLVLFLTVCTLCMCFGCNSGASAKDFYFFNTVIHVETHDKELSSSTADQLSALFSSLENQFDTKNDSSFVKAFNSGKKGDIFKLTDAQTEIFLKAQQCYKFSDGSFNPATYPLSVLWQFAPDFKGGDLKIPTVEQISATIPLCDFNKVIFDDKTNSLSKTEDHIMVDFGGMLKGYASDKAAEILVNAGHKKGYINVGGSSLELLNVESLSIRHPRPHDNKYEIINIPLKDKFNVPISTSGDYERYFVKDNVRYSHIIDSHTGSPIRTDICSVTIVGIEGIISDALSTSVCVYNHTPMDKDNSPVINYMKKILATYPSASIFTVYDNGTTKEILTNKKESEDFTLLDDSYSVFTF